jgi:uncharacterized protein (DUF3084 family)
MGSSGLILILAVLLLGGVIATVGDRIGTRVGKARLSLFNLRPRKTAVLVTILTGTLISASTLGILLAADKQLRDGLLRLADIKREFNATKNALQSTKQQKDQVQTELTQAKSEQAKVRQQLVQINQSLKTAVNKQAVTEAQRAQIQAQRNLIQGQLMAVSERAVALRSEIQRLQDERQTLVARQEQVKAQIAQRDQEIKQRTEVIAQRDQIIADRNAILAEKEQSLKQLETQQAYLEQQVKGLEQAALLSRLGNLAIQRNQVLASGVVKVVNPNDATSAFDQLLREANRKALQDTQPGVNGSTLQIVQITEQEARRLLAQISDGQAYVVRIIAGSNYYRGEKTAVAVFADAVLNRVVFDAGAEVAGTLLDPSQLTKEELQKIILEQLPAASSFRARGAGLLSDTVQIQQLQSWIQFIDQLRTYEGSIQVRTVAAEVTYTASPLKLGLIARQNGQIVLQTQ